MLKHFKLYIGVITILILLGYGSWKYIDFLQFEREKMAMHNYEIQALNMKKRVANMILLKQKSTTAMALSLADNQALINTILASKHPQDYYKELIAKFAQNTLYKNIWIQVLDKDLNSRYRSWSEVKGDSLAKLRKDLVYVAKTKKVLIYILKLNHVSAFITSIG
jgi:TFIIF-interacting CTD phosphatase-like protein